LDLARSTIETARGSPIGINQQSRPTTGDQKRGKAMEFRARFVVLTFVLTILPYWLFSQEPAPKQATESATPDQTTGQGARLSKTHCEIPVCVQKVLYFSNVSQASEFQDVTNTMRTIAEISRIQQIPGDRIIIVEGTAEQIAMAEKLAAEIDKDKRRFGGLGYRIDLKVQESESDKPVHTRHYLFLTEAHDAARVTEVREPARTQSEPAPEKRQPTDFGDARRVECLILAENEHTVEVSVELTFGSASERESAAASSPPLRIKQHVTIELDKPTTLSRVDDRASNRSYTVELTATRIKDRS
jgi:hypothetical protein